MGRNRRLADLQAKHPLRVGDVILGLNIVIFLTAAFFLGVDWRCIRS